MGRRNRPWKLFRKLENDVMANATSDDLDYFIVTQRSGLNYIKSAVLCRRCSSRLLVTASIHT